jgi:hypothetical protein
MSSRTFHKLEWQLTKESIRYECAVFGKAVIDFPDEEPAPLRRLAAFAPPRPPKPGHHAHFHRDKSGAIRMRAEFTTKMK